MRVKLKTGQVVLIDKSDMRLIAGKTLQYTSGYVRIIHPTVNGKRKYSYLHRYLLDLKPKSKLVVDHINKNTLDNRRCNLRKATRSQNSMNRSRNSTKTSCAYKGVYYRKNRNAWTAVIMCRGKTIQLGQYQNARAAAQAYNGAAKKIFGRFASLNDL